MRPIATTLRCEHVFAPAVVKTLTFLLLLALAIGQAFAGVLPAPVGNEEGRAAATRYGTLPLHFIPNEGQTDAAVKYMARGNGYSIYLTADEAVLALQGAGEAVVRMQLQGANADPVVEAESPLPARFSFLSGGEAAWITDVASFGEVHYREVYDGVDVVYYGTDRQKLEFDFVLQPGASPGVIRYRLQGADAIRLDAAGNLVLTAGGREVTQLAPFAYQTIDGRQVEVPSRYVLDGSTVSFELGAYDAGRMLVIDPVIEYSTFIGATGDDDARAIVVDAAGNAYVAGCTDGFPANLPGASVQGSPGALDAYVSKLSPDGTQLFWGTFIASVKAECAEAVAINGAGEVFVAGWTEGGPINGFPVVNAGGLDATFDGGPVLAPYDAFVAKLSASGAALLWSGYVGGTETDRAFDLAVDADGDVYVVGETGDGATDMTVAGVFVDNTHDGGQDAFVKKIADGAAPVVVLTDFLGGNGNDAAYGVAVDALENIYVTGTTTSSTTFPLASAFDGVYNGGGDAFFTKIEGDGSPQYLVSTYLGGALADAGNDIAVNAAFEPHIVGTTASLVGLPAARFNAVTAGAVHPAPLGGATDGFAVKLQANGNVLAYGTFLGGPGADEAHGVAVDAFDRAHVVGFTDATLALTVSPTQGAPVLAQEAFVLRLNGSGSGFTFATYLGGLGNDQALAVAVDADESTYVAGRTAHSSFPKGTFVAGLGFGAGHTPPAFDESFGGGANDAFVTKFGVSADLSVQKSVQAGLYAPLVNQQIVYEIRVTNNGPDAVSSFTVSDDLPAGLVFIADVGGVCTGPATVLPAVGTRGLITCDVQQPLASGASFTVAIRVEVRAVTPIQNCATVVNNTNDPSLVNNTRCVTITPQPQVNFWLPANQDAATATAFVSIPKGANSFGTTFVGTDGGGVYRTTDAGANWYPTNLIDVNVRGLARSTGNGALYAATYGAGLFRSQSGSGGHFDPVNFLPVGALAPQNLLSIAVNNFTPNNNAGDHDVWVGTDGQGVFFSNDDAASFSPQNNGLGSLVVRSLVVAQAASATPGNDRVFAGTHGRGVYFMDYDGGNTITGIWRDANGSTSAPAPMNASLDRAIVHALAVDGAGPFAVVYAGTNDGVYRGERQDNGTPGNLADDFYLWQHVLSSGAASWEDAPIVRALLVYECGGEEYLMAGTDGQYVYRIETADLDNGAPFAWERFDGLAPVNNAMSGLQSATVLALHFTDWDERLYAGTQDEGVHVSTDCGETFEQITNTSLQDAYRVIQALVFNPNGNRLYGGTFGFGVIMSDDLSNPQAPPILNWTSTNHGLENPWIYAMALNTVGGVDYLFAGTWGGGVFRSTDGGETWHFSGLANRIVRDIAVRQGILYAATDNGEVARSVDNGATWQEIGVATTAIYALGMDPLTGHIYAGTFGAGAYKSTDGGFTWTQTGLTTGYVFDFAFGENPETGVANTMFAGTATGVKYSTDNGATWSSFTSVGLTTADVRALLLADPAGPGGVEFLAGTWGGGVFRYDEPSDSWIRDGLPGHAIALFAVHPATGEVFVASDGGVYRKQFSTSSTTDAEAGETVPTGYRLAQNFPNPFNPSTRIAFELPEAAQVRLAVFDALGRQVQVLADGVLAAGQHEVTFAAHDLPSGVYFYRLQTARQTLTQTMILMK